MTLSLAPYDWAVTLLGGENHGRRRFMNLVNLAAQAVAVTLVFLPVEALPDGRWRTNISLLYYLFTVPPAFFVLLVALQALVVPFSGLVNWLLCNEDDKEQRLTYLIISWFSAFGLVILLLAFLSIAD